MDISGLLQLLVDLIVIAIVFGIAIYIFRFVAPPEPWAFPARAIVGLILLIWVIAMLGGGLPTPSHLIWRH
jgi:hypothetical protein